MLSDGRKNTPNGVLPHFNYLVFINFQGLWIHTNGSICDSNLSPLSCTNLVFTESCLIDELPYYPKSFFSGELYGFYLTQIFLKGPYRSSAERNLRASLNNLSKTSLDYPNSLCSYVRSHQKGHDLIYLSVGHSVFKHLKKIVHNASTFFYDSL